MKSREASRHQDAEAADTPAQVMTGNEEDSFRSFSRNHWKQCHMIHFLSDRGVGEGRESVGRGQYEKQTFGNAVYVQQREWLHIGVPLQIFGSL